MTFFGVSGIQVTDWFGNHQELLRTLLVFFGAIGFLAFTVGPKLYRRSDFATKAASPRFEGRNVHPERNDWIPGHETDPEGGLVLTLEKRAFGEFDHLVCFVTDENDAMAAEHAATVGIDNPFPPQQGTSIGWHTLRVPYPERFDDAFDLPVGRPCFVFWMDKGSPQWVAVYEVTRVA